MYFSVYSDLLDAEQEKLPPSTYQAMKVSVLFDQANLFFELDDLEKTEELLT